MKMPWVAIRDRADLRRRGAAAAGSAGASATGAAAEAACVATAPFSGRSLAAADAARSAAASSGNGGSLVGGMTVKPGCGRGAESGRPGDEVAPKTGGVGAGARLAGGRTLKSAVTGP